MLSELAIKLIVAGAIFTTVSGGLVGGYRYVKNKGYDEAMVVCAENAKKYEATVNERISRIEANSTMLINASKTSNELVQANVLAILKTTKGKTLTIVKNGECTPSPTFSDTFNAINKRVNETLKDIAK